MEEGLMTQRLGPNSLTIQLQSKPGSISSYSQESQKLSQNQLSDESQQNNYPIDKAEMMKSDIMRQSIFVGNRTIKQIVQPSQFMKNFKIQMYVHRFINNIFTNSYILRKTQQIKVQNSFFDRILIKNKTSILNNEQENSIPIFLPSNHFIIIWDVIGFICNLLMLWLAPFICTFDVNDLTVVKCIQSVIMAYLLIDFLISFNRAIIISAILITDRNKIIKEYLKTNFIFDVLKCTIWIMSEFGYSYLNILQEALVIIQVIIVYRNIQKYITEYFQFLYVKKGENYILDLIQLIIQIYYLAHIIACIWYYVGINTSYTGKSWLIQNNLMESSIFEKYNVAFYWATMTMTTVGYGDISAQNQTEMLIASIMMFLSSYAFAYTMSSIGMILKNIEDAKLNYKKNLIQITQYMIKNQVDDSIQGRIRNYLRLQLSQDQGNNEDDINQLLNQLPNHLQQDLNSDIQNRILKKMKLIINHFSKYTQQQVAKNLEVVSFIPGDIIYKQGDQQEDSLYFIEIGDISLIESRTGFKFKSLLSTQYLGYYSFFTGFPPKETAISNNTSQLYKISRQKFLEIIRQNQKDFEIFHHMKDKLQFNTSYVLFDQKCYFCARYNHVEIDCPLLQYKPDIEKQQKKLNFIQQQNFRKTYVRHEVKYSSLAENKNILLSIQAYQDDNQFNNEDQSGQKSNNSLLYQTSVNTSEIQQSSQVIMDQDFQIEQQHISRQNVKKTTMRQTSISHKKSSFAKIKPHLEQNQSSKKALFQQYDTIKEEYNMLQELYNNPILYSNQFNIDKIFLFQSYMPKYNFDIQIKLANKGKNKQKRYWKMEQKVAKYTFFDQARQFALNLLLFYKKNHQTLAKIDKKKSILINPLF